jgi:3-oxoacyl-[acyl-carrier protein] reductase
VENVARPATSGFLKTLSSEVAADGVTVSTVAPGWIYTPGMEEFFTKHGWSMEEANAWLKDKIGVPQRGPGRPRKWARPSPISAPRRPAKSPAPGWS